MDTDPNQKVENTTIHRLLKDRKYRNYIFSYLPSLFLVIQICFFGLMIIKCQKENSLNLGKIEYFSLGLWLAFPLFLLLVHVFYLKMLFIVSNKLITIYLSVIPLALGCMFLNRYRNNQELEILGVAGITLLVFLCFFYLMRRYYRIANVTLKESISKLRKHKIPILKSLLSKYMTVYFSSGLLAISIILFLKEPQFDRYGQSKTEHFYDNNRVVADVLLVLSILSVFYLVLVSTSTAFLYGASIYNMLCSEESHSVKDIAEASSSIANIYSYGSVCLGAFLVSIAKIVHFLARANNKRKKRPSLLVSILMVLIKSLSFCLEYIASQAYVYSALYGKSFCESSKMSFEAFSKNGLVNVLNLDICVSILNSVLYLFLVLLGFLSKYLFEFLFKECYIPGTKYTLDLEGQRNLQIDWVVIYFFNIMIPLASTFNMINELISGMCSSQLAIYVESQERLINNHSNFTKLNKLLEKEAASINNEKKVEKSKMK